MKCPNCGLIFNGKTNKCPRCGELLQINRIIDKQIVVFGSTHISLKTFLNIFLFNIIFVYWIVELCLNHYLHLDLRLSPWLFLIPTLFLFIMYDLILGKYYSIFIFGRFLSIIFVFSILFYISYRDLNTYTNYNVWQIIFGIIFPISFFAFTIGGLLYYFVRKKYDIVSIFINGLIILLLSSLSFGLSFIPSFRIDYYTYMRLITIFSYVLTSLIIVNSRIIIVIKLHN